MTEQPRSAAASAATATKSWRIGDVRITRIVEMGGGSIPPQFFFEADQSFVRERQWLRPYFALESGNLLAAIQAFVIESAGRVIIVDTCLGNDKPRNIAMFDRLQTDFLTKLVDAGFPPDRIDTVLCTHLHVDHVGWNTMLVDGVWVPTFPQARYLFGRVEWDYWSHGVSNPDGDIIGDSVRPVVDAGLADFVTSDYKITPEVRLVPTPGHTPGHVSVVIESQGLAAIVSGDVMHHPIQVSDPKLCCRFDVDQAAALAARLNFLSQYEDRPIPVFGTHFAHPTCGWIRKYGGAWRFEVDPQSADAPALVLRADGAEWGVAEAAEDSRARLLADQVKPSGN